MHVFLRKLKTTINICLVKIRYVTLSYRNKYQHYFLPVETPKKSTKFTWILYEFFKIRISFRMIFFCGIKFIFYN